MALTLLEAGARTVMTGAVVSAVILLLLLLLADAHMEVSARQTL